MRWRWRIALLTLLLSTANSCGGGDEANAPQPGQITGTWTATKIEYVGKASPSTTVDLISAGGAGTLVLNADRSYQLTVTPNNGQPMVTEGTWELDSDVMTMSPEGLPFDLQFDVGFSDDSLSLTGADAEYDFNGDQNPEQADLNMVFTR
jgi:hypothetical protein